MGHISRLYHLIHKQTWTRDQMRNNGKKENVGPAEIKIIVTQ